MSLDDQDIRALTFLACRTRPPHARQWTEADVFAEITKLRDRSLGAVICAVTRAAMDRGAERPSCIGSSGSHWGDTMVPQAFVPRTLDAGERCSVCSKSEAACRTTNGVDIHHGIDPHEFKSAAIAAKEATDASAHIATLKAELAPTSGPTERRTLEDMAAANPELHARVEAVRAANPGLTAPPLQEPMDEAASVAEQEMAE